MSLYACILCSEQVTLSWSAAHTAEPFWADHKQVFHLPGAVSQSHPLGF